MDNLISNDYEYTTFHTDTPLHLRRSSVYAMSTKTRIK